MEWLRTCLWNVIRKLVSVLYNMYGNVHDHRMPCDTGGKNHGFYTATTFSLSISYYIKQGVQDITDIQSGFVFYPLSSHSFYFPSKNTIQYVLIIFIFFPKPSRSNSLLFRANVCPFYCFLLKSIKCIVWDADMLLNVWSSTEVWWLFYEPHL